MPNQNNNTQQENKTDFGIGIALFNTMLALSNLDLNNATIANQNAMLDLLKNITAKLEKIEDKIDGK